MTVNGTVRLFFAVAAGKLVPSWLYTTLLIMSLVPVWPEVSLRMHSAWGWAFNAKDGGCDGLCTTEITLASE
eukprot:6194810-Pleurochrysis_carterae.AAC.3